MSTLLFFSFLVHRRTRVMIMICLCNLWRSLPVYYPNCLMFCLPSKKMRSFLIESAYNDCFFVCLFCKQFLTQGFGADNVISMDVILPNGTFTSVSKCAAPELWFALRGGGPGTFAVIVSATHRMHTDPGFIGLKMGYPMGT